MAEYKIGDFAKRFGVSVDFLKYYEKMGFIVPVNSKFRMYEFANAGSIIECLKYKNMQFSVKEVDDVLHHMSLEDYHVLMQQKEKELEKELLFRNILLENYHAFNEFLDKYIDKPDAWEIVEIEDLVFLPHSNGQDFVNDGEFYDELPKWVNAMPIVRSSKFQNYYEDNMFWGFSTYKSTAMQLELPLNNCIEIPKGKALIYININRETHPANPGSFESTKVKELVKKMNLKVQGPMLEQILFYQKLNIEKNIINGGSLCTSIVIVPLVE